MPPSTRSPPLLRITNGTFYRHHPSSVPVSAPGDDGPPPEKTGQHQQHQQHGHGRRNPPFFAGLTFSLPSDRQDVPTWCVVGPSLSGKTAFLQVLRGQHICLPPTARAYPFLATDAVPHRLRSAARAFRYVGFGADGPGSGSGSGLGPATSAYLSARYESRRETTDFALRDYLLGQTELNPYAEAEDAAAAADPLAKDDDNDDGSHTDPDAFASVVRDLRLDGLLDLPVAFLSNGQGRRARIARALLTRPAVLLLDEPFMGLDPPTVAALSPLLRGLAARAAPRVVLSARPQDPLPAWVSHLVYLRSDGQVAAQGTRADVLAGLRAYYGAVRAGRRAEDPALPVHALGEMGRVLTDRGIEDGQGFAEAAAAAAGAGVSRPSAAVPEQQQQQQQQQPAGEPLVEMLGCRVQYGDRVVLGNWTQPAAADADARSGLFWTVRRGERWGVFGPNGSGKTTIVSLLCSDHPQAYALPMRLFGRSRLPTAAPAPGTAAAAAPYVRPLTYWDIQARIGHSSPEVHQHMPRTLTARQVVASAWADTFRARPQLPPGAAATIDGSLRWFAAELAGAGPGSDGNGNGNDATTTTAWADAAVFGELSFSAQRLLLFLRAVVKNPDIVVLDEAFSGMDETVRDKCALFLSHGETRRLADDAASGQAAVAPEDVPATAYRGLSDQQALICIAHVREEVPDCVREWLCLPEANTGKPARFGRLDGPLRTDRSRWETIWSGASV